MADEVVCAQCDLPEWKCQCDKYCSMCKSWDNVYLCADGQYYCPDCREACDVKLANPGRT
jgi:sulfur transfer complex TusBCD TusB component (DsrH family)